MLGRLAGADGVSIANVDEIGVQELGEELEHVDIDRANALADVVGLLLAPVRQLANIAVALPH